MEKLSFDNCQNIRALEEVHAYKRTNWQVRCDRKDCERSLESGTACPRQDRQKPQGLARQRVNNDGACSRDMEGPEERENVQTHQ